MVIDDDLEKKTNIFTSNFRVKIAFLLYFFKMCLVSAAKDNPISFHFLNVKPKPAGLDFSLDLSGEDSIGRFLKFCRWHRILESNTL